MSYNMEVRATIEFSVEVRDKEHLEELRSAYLIDMIKDNSNGIDMANASLSDDNFDSELDDAENHFEEEDNE